MLVQHVFSRKCFATKFALMCKRPSKMHVLNMHFHIAPCRRCFATNGTTVIANRVGDNILIELLVATCKDK